MFLIVERSALLIEFFAADDFTIEVDRGTGGGGGLEWSEMGSF